MPSGKILDRTLDRTVGFVTSHNLVTLVIVLLLTAGVVAGIPQVDTTSQAGGGDDLEETVPAQKAEYIQQHYVNDTDDDDNVTSVAVYVHDPDGNVLSREALLASLSYQEAVTANDTLAGALADRGAGGYVGVANLVARAAAGDPQADLDQQIAALEAASDEEVETIVRETFTEGSETLRFLPNSYEPGTATSSGHRTFFFVDQDRLEDPSDATLVLHEAAEERTDPEYFTLTEHAVAEANQQMNQNTVQLVLPIALALILFVLAFSYRDPVDVVVGMTGVVLAILWMFGILGWLGVSAGVTLIIGPVLVAGLSIDFGFHVFNRYREQRGPDEGIEEPMRRGVRSLVVALGLVTVTAAIGFLSNLVNPLPLIRDLGVGITLGVVSAFLIFVTLVPALKVTADGLLEWIGLDRRKRPLGHGRIVAPVLGGSVALARRVAPLVIVLALVAGAAGATAWTDLDRESFQQQTGETAEWKQNLPGPLAWEDPEFYRHLDHVESEYRSVDGGGWDRSQVLVEGDVTGDGTLDRVEAGVQTARDRGIVFEQSGVSTVRSPASVIRAVAETDASFADTVADADVDDDGVPDRNLTGVYDHLYAVAPDRAAGVIERTDGEYRSLRVVVPVDRTAEFDQRADDMQAAAAAIEDGDDGLTATAVGTATVGQAQIAAITDGILQTLVIALTVMGLALMAVYRLVQGSASLGAVTVLPIALVVGIVVAGMELLSVPLTLLTALLMSLVVGLGVDYNIHVSDRFAQELERGGDAVEALRTAVTGTGGALLGSTLTSVGAFATLVLHPHPQMQSFGAMVVLALTASFVVSVFVLPSLIVAWTWLVPGVDRIGWSDGEA